MRRPQRRYDLTEQTVFVELYRARADAVMRFFLLRTLDVNLALELTAETFAVAFERRAQFRGASEREAVSWVFAIASRQLGMFYRSGKVRLRAIHRLGLQLPTPGEEDIERALELVAFEQQHSGLTRRLSSLPARQREAVELRVVDELSYSEVADRLGVSEQTARARVSRGLSSLRSLLSVTPEV
jgi:RNA polymerase sigma-70 factor (ECF subfamily)